MTQPQPARSIGSLSLRLGMVTVPLKLYTAQSERKISFNLIVKATGARVQQQTIDASNGKLVTRDELVAGFEYTAGQFVTFTDAELKAIEAEGRPGELRISEAIPLASIDSRHVGKAVYLGPNKGGERAFSLIATLLSSRGYALIGQRGTRTRDDLILVREHACALVMHELLYADEVRPILETVSPVHFSHTREELELGEHLLNDRYRASFNPARFEDGGGARVQSAVDRKVEGKEVVVPAAPLEIGGVAVELLDQLRMSVAGTKKPRAAAPASEVRGKGATSARGARARAR